MHLKELRIKNFLRVKEARLIFGQPGALTVEAAEADGASTVRATELALDALSWVLFGELQPGRALEVGCSAELEFDHFAVHRKTTSEPPGTILRLFQYSPNPYGCVATVRDLTAKTVEETQREILKTIGFSDIAGLRDWFQGSPGRN